MAINPNLNLHSLPPLFTHKIPIRCSNLHYILHPPISAISKENNKKPRNLFNSASIEIPRNESKKPLLHEQNSEAVMNPKNEEENPSHRTIPRKPRRGRRSEAAAIRQQNSEAVEGLKNTVVMNPKNEEENPLHRTIPRKPRRGRRSEAAAVEDFMRDSLEETLAAIRQQNSEGVEGKEEVIKERVEEEVIKKRVEGEGEGEGEGMVVEEEDGDWPVDAEVGWGVRASEYFEKHPIKNVVGDDGVEIDWEGELDDNLVNEINQLEWESFAFRPSPLIVLVFERYNRASENWRALKELEKAAKVYWNAKDRLPPRTVKLDMNLETDLAYALQVRECPQLLFLRGNRILYRESQIRTADELVQMIAHFYFKAKRPSWMKDAKLYS